MRISELLKTKKLVNSTSPKLDVELLLVSVLNKSRSFLYSHPEYELTQEQRKNFDLLYDRRETGEPIAYILGKKEFWSFELTINKNVLIPRPETEILVEVALRGQVRTGDRPTCHLSEPGAFIADLGTGSGAVAIALAHERPKWHVVATDINEEALKLARYNAQKLNLKNIEFYCGDWCTALPYEEFDMIVSNPPYIARNDVHLQQGDVRFEPKIALEADDGLSELKKIIVQAKENLKKGGILILEHGYDQSEKVQELLKQNKYEKITPHKDLAGIYRIVEGVRS